MNKMIFINGTRYNTNKQSSINYAKFYRIINNLQRRIFVAKQQGRFRIMRKLQKLLLTAHSNRLLAVHQVCKLYAGNTYTPTTERVSHFLFLAPSKQLFLVKKLKEIHLNKWKPTFNTRTLYESKSNRKLRARDITVVTDQALQRIVKTALEPEWGAIFQKYCYKLPKEQSVHDVIQYTRTLYENTRSIKNWIVKVNIKRCFDSISQDFLTKLLHSFPAKRIMKSWFNVEVGNFSLIKTQDTHSIVSVLFGNIISNHIKKTLNIFNNKRGNIKEKNRIVHYKNEFIVICKTEEDALKIREGVHLLLHSGGLDIGSIQISHITEGFNFLGFNIRLYNRKQKLIIKPSKESVLKLKKKLKKMWIKSNGSPIAKIIKNFNLIIRRWADYFKIGNSSKIFKLLDYFMYRRQLRFTRRTHSKKSCKWIQQRYWSLLYLKHMYNCMKVFGCKETGAYMLKFTWTK
uniref:Putative reverse transcriptase n=1 Tax=Oedogonium cardiacum TaxID=55995 RepID=B2X1X4_OEDCA|nr:putative reverse transcriptase [Oedogonium cardiacum]ABU88187.1 putative reverse transcriptase [Oedogonium cardiacum]ACC97272.1 putative reverse transcriptase [Oedogonium cardiacum]